ncbi:MAG: GIY-YIG nuclease family protein [Clostridiales Family XIII bacterium]|jgi:putative endonuclease|nr:GIY-YIG nuclease family protein [Clostridiales Family XIII bacterium]
MKGEAKEKKKKKSLVYLVECADGTLYCGWTNDIQERLKAHNEGIGAKYTRSRRPVTLAYIEEAENRSAALRRERQIKRMKREKKLEMIRTSDAPTRSP